MNQLHKVNGLWVLLVGLAFLLIGWWWFAWARRKGKVRQFLMSRVGPAVPVIGVAAVIMGVVVICIGH